jgi:glycerate kinase
MCRAASAAGWTCDVAPVADGGEGTLEAIGGAVRHTRVTGPLGEPVDAEWRLRDGTAVIEMARASGLMLAGGADDNDPVQATTRGTGELIVAALEAGARRIIVGVGGSATTDGGLGAITAFGRHRLHGVEVLVACDVDITFARAAELFGPQKGASPAQVALLTRRLERLAEVYRDDYGVDVTALAGSGAAGGLAGGLAAVGATLVPGFDVVADAIGLPDRLENAALVATGEGFLDAESFHGKAVGGVAELAGEEGVPVLAVVGDADEGVAVPDNVEVVSLVAEFGEAMARGQTLECVDRVIRSRTSATPSP